MSVKIQFDMSSLLAPYTFLGRTSTPGADSKPLFNLATGEAVKIKPGDDIKKVSLTVFSDDRPQQMGMAFLKGIPVGNAEYSNFLRGILNQRELEQLGRLAELTYQNDRDTYRSGGDHAKVADEVDQMTRLSNILETNEVTPRNARNMLIGSLASDAMALAQDRNPLAIRAAGLLRLALDFGK